MPLYRVLKPLTTWHQPGDVVDGARFKWLALLVKNGALVPVNAPPLAVLPGWADRWQLLPAELQSIEGVVTARAAEIAAACGVDVATAQLWQVEALEFLKPRKCRRG